LCFSGYNNTADSWISSYESDTFEEDLVGLLDQLQPLYNELHTYVRSKLQEKYKDHPFPATGHIPAHLLGMVHVFIDNFDIFFIDLTE
jgi:peptidyl-dipeptidase A